MKGAKKMKIRKIFLIAGLLAVLALLIPCSHTLAGGPEDPPTTGTIIGPELWGVMIIDCGQNILMLRVKRIVDCNVETQAFDDTNYQLGCPADATTPLWRMLGVTLFDINPNPAVMDPIITKVKNFKKEPGQDLYSFDVQIKFWTP
jgi:hypothetical protein